MIFVCPEAWNEIRSMQRQMDNADRILFIEVRVIYCGFCKMIATNSLGNLMFGTSTAAMKTVQIAPENKNLVSP